MSSLWHHKNFMEAQRPIKQASMSLVTPQMPKMCGCHIGGMNLSAIFLQTSICFKAGQSEQPGATHALQLPYTGSPGTLGAQSCMTREFLFPEFAGSGP